MSTSRNTQKAEKATRKQIVQARMTPEEVQELERYAKSINAKNNSEALRAALRHAATGSGGVLSREMAKGDGSEENKAVLVALSRIGNNVNQIARRVNAGSGSVEAEELEAIRAELAAIREGLASAGKPGRKSVLSSVLKNMNAEKPLYIETAGLVLGGDSAEKGL